MSASTKLEFRQATKLDIDPLIELRIMQLVDEGYPETIDIRKDLAKYFSTSLENGSIICWVGLVEGEIVATAGLCFYQHPSTFSNPSGRIAYVTNMYTDPAYRKRGVASQLLNLLVETAKALNYTSIKLHASIHGKGIYEKAGFTDSDGYMSMIL